jgi:hypothetical protein
MNKRDLFRNIGIGSLALLVSKLTFGKLDFNSTTETTSIMPIDEKLILKYLSPEMRKVYNELPDITQEMCQYNKLVYSSPTESHYIRTLATFATIHSCGDNLEDSIKSFAKAFTEIHETEKILAVRMRPHLLVLPSYQTNRLVVITYVFTDNNKLYKVPLT